MEEIETEEEKLFKKHRKEKKELQAKIQGMKNAVAKNDKKRRKQLVEEVAKFEAELELRHEEEVKLLTRSLDESSTVESSINGITNLELEIENETAVKQSRIS
ncbi:deubiquitinase OTUD6B-like [Scyliorhinus canicula]|uniref:deubiquitinase OTUD6B-like n=1 Tax=Scyliorhinus canicula TaxID=7830 RepID=UPI0018F61EEB|nr:deubiquitinase OTUD6B-like [Scyliorhinus canicula]